LRASTSNGYYGKAPSGKLMQDRKREYSETYGAWQAQLRAVHRVLLEGERLEPPKLKALLNREARAKERYDRARRALLGLSEEE
jgi:hypothetical protein